MLYIFSLYHKQPDGLDGFTLTESRTKMKQQKNCQVILLLFLCVFNILSLELSGLNIEKYCIYIRK